MSNFLTNDTLYRKAPSIFAESKAATTTDEYRHISTIELIERLAKEGFRGV